MDTDPAVHEALQRAIRHAPPFTDEELAAVTVLNVEHARDISAIAACRNINLLILIGCEVPDLDPLRDLAALESVQMEMSTLRDVTALAGAPSLIGLSLAKNMLVDLSPLLDCPKLVRLDVTGNPLSDVSYRDVLEELRRRRCLITASDEREWRLTRRLHEEGYPASFYRGLHGPMLCALGLSVTPLPEYGHVPMEPDELQRRLDAGTLDLQRLFAPGQRT